MRERPQGTAFTAGLVLGLAGGWLFAHGPAALGNLMQRGREALERPQTQASQPSVMVVVVGTRGRVASVRAAVSDDRIMAASEDGFALRGRRLVAVSLEDVGNLLMRAGWDDAPLKILTAARHGRRGQQSRDPDRATAEAEAAILADLMNKPSLNYLEAQRLLSLM